MRRQYWIPIVSLLSISVMILHQRKLNSIHHRKIMMIKNIGDMLETRVSHLIRPDDEMMQLRNDFRVQYLENHCTPEMRIPRKDAFGKVSAPWLYVSAEHRIVYCNTPKVATTSMLKLVGVLTKVLNSTNDTSKGYIHAVKMPSCFTLNKTQMAYSMKNYRKVIVARNPFDRTLSCYIDKFVPKKKGKAPVFKRLSAAVAQAYGKTGKNDSIYPSFEEFVRYITDTKNSHNISAHFSEPRHWQPQYTLCDPCSIKYDYIMHLETILQDSEYLLREIGAPESLHLPMKNAHLSILKEDYIQRILKKDNLTERDILARDPSKLLRILMGSFEDQSLIAKLYNYLSTDFDLFRYPNPLD